MDLVDSLLSQKSSQFSFSSLLERHIIELVGINIIIIIMIMIICFSVLRKW